jgi:uncharacterized protein
MYIINTKYAFMMDKNTLRQIIIDQREQFKKTDRIIKRNINEDFLTSKKISVISGVRRSGKSTLLKYISQSYENYYYLNFEDERLLNFNAGNFNILYEVFLSLYGEQKIIFFDEIQDVAGWEKFVSRLYGDGYKIYITGSNAKLLSSELATSLTGRHIKIELFPFSFAEFLEYKKFSYCKNLDSKEKSRLLRLFDEYLEFGAFPEMVESQSEEEIKQLYQDILIKDLIIRFGIREIKAFRELALYLLSNISSNISFNNLMKILEFKSVTTVKNYIENLESAYLFFTVNKFDYSLKKQIINDRKIYSIDTGLINFVSFAFSKNTGKLLENLVFIELRRRGVESFYHHAKKECDFLLRKGRAIISAIQVTRAITKENKEREVAGLMEAMDIYNLNTGLILTYDQGYEIKAGHKKILIMPIWKFLLEDGLINS